MTDAIKGSRGRSNRTDLRGKLSIDSFEGLLYAGDYRKLGVLASTSPSRIRGVASSA